MWLSFRPLKNLSLNEPRSTMMNVEYFEASWLVVTLGLVILLVAMTTRAPSGRTSAALTSFVSCRQRIDTPNLAGTVFSPAPEGWTVASWGSRLAFDLTRCTSACTAACEIGRAHV